MSRAKPRRRRATAPVPQRVGLRALAVADEPVGLNGRFDRFGLQLLTMVLAANNRGETAFYATIRRSQSEEGIFLAKADGKIAPIAVAGDPVPDQAGQLIAGFGERPAPVMNDEGSVAFIATLAGGRGAAGVFLASEGKLRTIASSGMKAPVILGGIGVFAEFEAVSLNSRGDVAFLAWVRHGRETIEVIYVARKVGAVHQLTKVAAAGEPAPGGGFFAGFGAPVVNNRGAIAFPAVVKLGPALGAIFVAPAESPAHLFARHGRSGADGRHLRPLLRKDRVRRFRSRRLRRLHQRRRAGFRHLRCRRRRPAGDRSEGAGGAGRRRLCVLRCLASHEPYR